MSDASAKGMERPARATLLLAGLAVLTLYSFLRGQSVFLQPAGTIYYVVDYSNGFVRRALIGQLYMLFYTRAEAAQAWATTLVMHRLTSFLVLAGVMCWFWAEVWQRRQFAADRLILLYALFAVSQFYPTLAATTTYLDSYVFLLMLAAFALAARGKYVLATCLVAIGPLIHELVVVLSVPLLLMLIWRHGLRGLRRPDVAVLCLTPFVVALLAFHFETTHAVALQMQRAPIPPDWRAEMAQWQFGNTFRGDFAMMLHKLSQHPIRAIATMLAFLLPTIAMLAVAVPAMKRRSAALLTLAALSPLGTLLVAWDLSRLVVITQFAAILSILFMATSGENRVPAASMAPTSRRAGWGFVAALAMLPLIYGYFDHAVIFGNGVMENMPGLSRPMLKVDAVLRATIGGSGT